MTSGVPVTPTFDLFSGSIGESGGFGLGLDCFLASYRDYRACGRSVESECDDSRCENSVLVGE